MKTLALFISGLCISFGACTQNVLPGEVKTNFDQKFSQARNVKWSMENEKEWEAEFVLDGHNMSASFDPSGKWLETEKELKNEDLPSAVMKVIHTQFPDYKLTEPEQIEKPGFSGYEAELKKGDQTLEVVFSANGDIVSKKVEKDKD